jgi:hypothetical protein
MTEPTAVWNDRVAQWPGESGLIRLGPAAKPPGAPGAVTPGISLKIFRGPGAPSANIMAMPHLGGNSHRRWSHSGDA